MADFGKDLKQAYDDGYADVQRGRWVSVEDALPDVGQRVLTYSGRGGIQICRYDGLLEDELSFFCSATSRRYPPATHWMPMPKPPVVEVKDDD